MHRTRPATSRTAPRRRPAHLIALALVPLLLAVACAPMPTEPTTTTTSTTTTTVPPRDQFCEVWQQRELVPETKGTGIEPPLAPAPPFGYFLEPDTVVTAREIVQTGTSCKDPAARIRFFDGAIVGTDTYLPPNNLAPDFDPPVASPYPLNLEPGRAQAPGVELTSINIELTPAGIRIWGTLKVTVNGVASTITFDGSYLDLENYRVSVNAPALALPGLAPDPVSFSGLIERKAGFTTIDINGAINELTVDDVTLRSVVLRLFATTTSGISFDIGGRVEIGDDFVEASLSAALDAEGRLRDLQGRVAVDISSTANGQLERLTGEITLSGSSTNLRGTFNGSASIGTDQYTRVGGTAQIGADGIVTVTGYFDLLDNGTTVRLAGTLTIDTTGAVPNLRGQVQGGFTGLTDTGDVFELAGTINTTIVNGELVTTVDGDLRVGQYGGAGSAVVTTDGNRTGLAFTGRLDVAGAEANVAGAIAVEDGSLVSLALDGSLQSTLELKGVTFGGAISVDGDRTGIRVALDGAITSEGVSLTGSTRLELDDLGRLVAADAQVLGTFSDGTYTAAGFAGTFRADGDSAELNGVAGFAGPNVNYGQAGFSALIPAEGPPVISARGQLSLRSGVASVFGDFAFDSGQILMARVGLVYPPIVIDPERLWVQLTAGPSGCVNVRLLDATFLAGIFFGLARAQSDLGC